MSNSDSRTDPIEFRFLISTSCPLKASARVSRVHNHMATPACHPVTPGAHLSVTVVSARIDVPIFSNVGEGRRLHLCISRLHLSSLALRPADLLNSLSEPLSGNLMLRVTLGTSLKLYGELPNSHGRTSTDKSYVLHGIPYNYAISRDMN
jgi:hypothetical protein